MRGLYPDVFAGPCEGESLQLKMIERDGWYLGRLMDMTMAILGAHEAHSRLCLMRSSSR
jgi:hypothetical protein